MPLSQGAAVCSFGLEQKSHPRSQYYGFVLSHVKKLVFAMLIIHCAELYSLFLSFL